MMLYHLSHGQICINSIHLTVDIRHGYGDGKDLIPTSCYYVVSQTSNCLLFYPRYSSFYSQYQSKHYPCWHSQTLIVSFDTLLTPPRSIRNINPIITLIGSPSFYNFTSISLTSTVIISTMYLVNPAEFS